MKLLILTQKVNINDDTLGFMHGWIAEFGKHCEQVIVICLEKAKHELPGNAKVFSLGKEKNRGKLARILKFWQLIFTLKYNRVFVHMNPEYITLGGWYWFLRRVPMYLWYTHYKMHIHMWLSGIFCKRMFAATKQSLPQYEDSKKKVITGHGIDLNFWLPDIDKEENRNSEYNLVSIHRLCRSKRLELGIKALKHLPKGYNLSIYGRDIEKDYYQELKELVKREKLEDRVKFKGPMPMAELKKIYPQYRVMVNMASETIDKTMLEGMLFGVYPVTTKGNSQAIGLPVWPEEDEPKTIAKFILAKKWKKYNKEYLQDIVKERHSLSALIAKMNKYIVDGN